MKKPLVLAFSAAAALALAVPAQALPAGTVAVPRGTSDQPVHQTAIGVTSDGHVIAVADDEWTHDRTFFSVAVADKSLKVLALPHATDQITGVAGDRLFLVDADGSGHASRLLSETAWHTCAPAAGASFVDELADGWVQTQQVGSDLVVSHVVVGADGTCAVSGDPLTVPHSAAPSTAPVGVGSGLVLASGTGAAREARYYPWAHLDQPVVLRRGAAAAPVSTDPIATDGADEVAWVDPVADRLVRTPVDGGDPALVTTTTTALPVLTDTVTAWVDDDGALRSAPAAGGTVSTSSYSVDPRLVGSATHLFVTKGGRFGTAGLYSTSGAAAAPALLRSSGRGREVVSAMRLDAGRLVYASDKGSFGTWSIHGRTVTRTTDGVTLGGDSLLVKSASDFALSLSGRRMTYAAGTDAISLLTSGAASTVTSHGFTSKVSGTRLLVPTSSGEGFQVRDLTKRTPTQVFTGVDADLWGNYLLLAKADGTLQRTDLQTRTTVTLRSPSQTPLGSIGIWGSRVAWVDGGNVLHDRDLVAKTTTTTPLGNFRVDALQVSVDRVLMLGWRTVEEGSGAQLMWLKHGSTEPQVVTSDLSPYAGFAIDDELLAWSDRSSQAQVLPLAHFTAPPRYLGNAWGEASFTPDGDGDNDTWSLEVPLTKDLTSCSVTITKSGRAVRVLPCSTTAGEARVLWNGATAKGVYFPTGTYGWRFSGRDADGAVQYYDGSATAITGTLTIK